MIGSRQMLRKRVITVSLIAALVALAGCTSDGGSNDQGSSGGSGGLQSVLDAGTIQVGIIPDNPPSSIQESGGEWSGYDVDIANRLGDALGVDVEFVSTTGGDRVTVLQTDRADVVISTFTPTNERARQIAFSIPYSASGTTPLFREGTDIQSFDDISGMTVSLARGSTADQLVSEEYPDTQVERFDNIADAVQALRSGQVDAVLEDNQIVNQLVSENPGLTTLDTSPPNLGYLSMGVQRGNQTLLNYLNNFIRNINISGENNELYNEWYGNDLPPLYDY